MRKTSNILFLVFTILVGFFSTLFVVWIYLTTSSPKANLWIDYPPTKLEGKSSEKENKYISSFFGSEFSNYSIYMPNDEPNPNDPFTNSTFLGDLKNITNVVNDSANLNLWKQDVDHTQFVVYIKEDNIKEITLNIQTNSEIEVSYGWLKYIYSKGPGLPEKGIWTADATTEEHTLISPLKNTVYIAWISLYTTLNSVNFSNLEIQLETSITTTEEEKYLQTNDIYVNLINQDYSHLINENNALAILNNDQRLVNYYTQGKIPFGLDPDDSENETAYLKYSWDNYLEKTYQELNSHNLLNYYSTFFTNTHGRKTHKESTWEFKANDPSLITWHRRKVDGKYEIYVPDDEKEAFFYNLKRVAKTGIKNIFLRGLDNVKYYVKIGSDNRYKSNMGNYIWDDETGTLQNWDLAMFNQTNQKDSYTFSPTDYIKIMLDWLATNIKKCGPKNLNYFLYFDEFAIPEMKDFIAIFNGLKKEEPEKYGFLKIGFATLDREINHNDAYLDSIDLIYLNNFNFDNISNSKIFNNFVQHRNQLGLKTSQYKMEYSYMAMPGYDYANHAFWMNYMDWIGTPGFLNYTLTSWESNSGWTDQHSAMPSGELMYIYPSAKPKEYVSKSVRFEMLSFGYRMSLKQQILRNKNVNVNNYFKNYAYLKDNKIDYRSSKKIRYLFNQKISEKNLTITKSPFLNWIIRGFDHSSSIAKKMAIDYQIINNSEVI